MQVNEEILNEIYDKMQEKFVLMRAYCNESLEDEKKSLTSSLKYDIKDLRLGYRRYVARFVDDEGVTCNEYSVFSNSMGKRRAIALGEKYKQLSIIYGDGQKCEEICTVPFIDSNGIKYSVGDVVKTLDLTSAKDIFLSKVTASTCMQLNDLNKKTFHLTEVLEMYDPRPSYFQGGPTFSRIIKY